MAKQIAVAVAQISLNEGIVLALNAVNCDTRTKVGNTYLGTGVTVDRLQRQYDTFVESNLRSSNSDLLSQEPMVNYANRVIDIMGGPSMGLSSALDQFFGSARNLSADPASFSHATFLTI